MKIIRLNNANKDRVIYFDQSSVASPDTFGSNVINIVVLSQLLHSIC